MHRLFLFKLFSYHKIVLSTYIHFTLLKDIIVEELSQMNAVSLYKTYFQ